MRQFLPESILYLAQVCFNRTGKPLYAVGGSVRDFLAGFSLAEADYDLCAPIPAEQFSAIAQSAGFHVNAVYKRTGTVKFSAQSKENNGKTTQFEYAAFRYDSYVRGEHTPAKTEFTEDIFLDAKRRDFTCNAVYYNLSRGDFRDPLGGVDDVKAKRLKCVDDANKVFSEDGLRLMRLARMAGATGFTPTEDTLAGARKNASLILDVSPERIYAELLLCLSANERYGVKNGVYTAFALLDKTRVLDYILPELTAGRGVTQRADFHNHDVLEHSLRAAGYAEKSVRLAALLHDVGKSEALQTEGRFASHPERGEKIAREILTRLKAPANVAERVCALVKYHMYDYDLQTKETKLRRFLVEHAELIGDLLLVKQADYSACKDDLSVAPCVKRWQALIEKMKSENVPFSLKQLAVKGNEIAGVLPASRCVGNTLRALLLHVAVHPEENVKERLLYLAPKLCPTEYAEKKEDNGNRGN